MKRVTACAVVLASVLLAPPARGQTAEGWWSPTEVGSAESAGEVVLTFTMKDPGRTVYYTSDGDCRGYPTGPWVEDPANGTPLSPAECGRPARAPEDYGAVRGEWIFTQAGSRTVTIPIVDDDLDEIDWETFTVNAAQHDDVAETTVWYSAYIHIEDNDPRVHGDAPPPAVITTVARVEQRPTGSSAGAGPAPRAPVSTTVASPPADLEAALPSRELEPGPGFELVIAREPEPAPERDDRNGGSAPWLALGLGTTALGSGGVVWLRRQRRWSPTS